MNPFRSFLNSIKLPFQKKNVNFFIHIPKTAGTSFRNSLEDSQYVLSDYGDAKHQTSEEVQLSVYDNSDVFSLNQYLTGRNSWLCGHVWLTKYSGIVVAENIATIVREPIERVLSHYAHEKRWGQNQSIDLNSFLKTPYAKNTQCRFLAGCPISLIGVVGITEDYENSLKIINQRFGTQLVAIRENVNEKKVYLRDTLSEETLKLIRDQNQEDIKLYEKATILQKERLAFLNSNKVWSYMFAQVSAPDEVRGIIFRSNVNDPVAFRIRQGSKTLYEGIASEFVSCFPDVKFTRDRYVGFTAKLPKSSISSTEQLEVECSDTLQAFKIVNEH